MLSRFYLKCNIKTSPRLLTHVKQPHGLDNHPASLACTLGNDLGGHVSFILGLKRRGTGGLSADDSELRCGGNHGVF